jgi:hypothetical protein
LTNKTKQQGEHTAALTMYENALRKSTGLSQSANPDEAEEGGGTPKMITLTQLFFDSLSKFSYGSGSNTISLPRQAQDNA